MKKIIFIDQNESLVKKVKKAVKYLPWDITVKQGDIFKEKGLIVSASNPTFSMGGGLDAQIAKRFPKECTKVKQGKNQRIGDIVFTITVNEELKATGELVKKALKFALVKTRTNETVLVSGLGTGIGGLDEDDFVWLFLSAIVEDKKGFGWGIKYTKKNGFDFYSGKKHYQVGKWLEEEETNKSGEECSRGLHLGKTFAGAGNYNLPEKIYFCVYKTKNRFGDGTDKVRVSKLLPLFVCPRRLGYGPNGKVVLKNLNKKFNPEQYNPYQATKMPNKKRLIGLLDQVWDQVGDQVWDQVWDQVGDQVRDQVWAQVWAQVWDQVWDQAGVCAYFAVKEFMGLDYEHPAFDLIRLGVMAIKVGKSTKIFGKNGKYLGDM